MQFGRRKFLLGVAASGGAAVLGIGTTGCAPQATLEAAAPSLMGLWDAVIPGTWAGVVEDRLPSGLPAPGATEAGVHHWLVSQAGTFPAPLDYLTDWFLRAWSADLDLWAGTFHLFGGTQPTFG